MELHEDDDALFLLHQREQPLGQAHRRDRIGEEQLADFHLAGRGGGFVLRTGDTGIDVEHIELRARQALRQSFETVGIIQLQRFDPHAGERLERIGACRVAHGGDHLPALTGELPRQAETEAARGADDENGSAHGMLRAIEGTCSLARRRADGECHAAPARRSRRSAACQCSPASLRWYW